MACLYTWRLLPLYGSAGSFDDLVLEMQLRWSLTYVATPIAVAVREGLFTGSGHSNSTNLGVQPSLLCTASL